MNPHIRKHLAFGSVIAYIVFDNEKTLTVFFSPMK